MYLKSIEIIGFKSFAEKTRVELKPGITGVIGPNGCGKSNIMEAIRWCIGEMSWKSLRSDSMVSVIFAGTARRAPMSLAEVTLTFDNAQSLLPVQYSEVSISRRLFRSGESEYWMNKTQCRLRDIRELFLDTGIGNDGYAIIDQGGVDFVLASKPEERRALFEEAAGVAKYKAKREDALRKLDRVEIDLARLQDSVSLINEQIKKLDSDARKANLFQKYKAELASMEAGQIIQEVAQIENDAASESERVVPASEKLAALRTEMEADGARLAALNLERSSHEAVVMESNQKIAACKSETGRLEERIQNAQATAADIQTQLSSSQEELKSEKERAAAMDPDIDKALAAHEEAAAKLDAARKESEAFSSEFSRLEEDLKGAQVELDAARSRLLAATDAHQRASRGLSSAESSLGQLEFQVRQTLKEHEKNSTRAETARAELALGREAAQTQKGAVEAARQVVAGLDTARGEAQSELSAMGSQTLRLHGETVQLKAQIQALEAQGGKDPYWVGAHAVINAGIQGVIGTVRSLLEVEDAYRPFVEDALGERLYAVVCEDLAAAKAGVEFLQSSGRGRARFLVASSLPERGARAMGYPSEARPLMDHVRFSGAHERMLAYLLEQHYALGGGLYGDHWICGGAHESETVQLKLSDMGALTGRLAAAEREQNELEAKKSELEAKAARIDAERKAAEAALQQQISQWHALEAQRESKEQSLRLFEEETSVLESEAARILADTARVQSDILDIRQSLAEIKKEEEFLRAAEAESSRKHEAVKEEAAKRVLKREHLESALANIAAHRNVLKDQLDRLVGAKEALERSTLRRAAQALQWQERLKELSQSRAEAEERLDQYRRDLAVLENESASLFVKLQELQQAAQALEASLSERKKESEALNAELHASELKVSQLKSRQDFLKARLNEEWQLSWDEAREKYSAQPVDHEKLQFLRRRIAALGNVNMAAPEEYEELAKKRDYLQGQINDLNQAKQDLRSVITKINSTTRENFRQTFEEVREHFRKLYGVLFEGGEADLVLTDQENLLESGVEIVAQPPGKKLQSISQLSGGEKTLTAVALLFAFFMVKPSPMCMLDEADAALDDANVDRFVSLLKEFGGKTQFLIVSHNKKTMEACDVIYGITMEESGVSQLMSVDFKKKSSAAAEDSRRAEPDGAAT